VTQNKKTAQVQIQQEMASGLSTRTRDGRVAGREPMTGAQASYLKSLCEEVREPNAFQEGLSQSEASRRINALKEKLRLRVLPPHTD
jgi:hypothetical protein